MSRKSNVKATARKPAEIVRQSVDGMDSLAALFRTARTAAGYDLASLAAHALVSIEVIRRLESEPEYVPLQDLYAVANVLNLDPGIVLELLHSATP